jgi:hypothetical protein
MFYRRRILLALLDGLGGEVSATDFQKLLFLFCKCQSKPSFDFVPYLYGGFSFQSYADKRALTSAGLIDEDENNWRMKNASQGFNFLNDEDKSAINKFCAQHKDLRGNKLIRHVYISYPYFAINSSIVAKHLTDVEMMDVERLKPSVTETALFSIGYEGKSIDAYWNLLVKNGVKILCDVRRNPLSMKYGFSKGQMQNLAQKLNIKYVHIPELGIASDKRQHLETQDDYDRLFAEYKKTTIASADSFINEILQMLLTAKCVAVTCFEANPAQCHRTLVAEAVIKMARERIPLKIL